jgi:4-carboxymuconolactone decarboxylase
MVTDSGCRETNQAVAAREVDLRKEAAAAHFWNEISMDDQQHRDDGMARRRRVLGNAWVDKANAGKNSFNSEFQDLITRYAWNEVWTRPHFDERTRRILVMGTLLALCQWDEFRLHVRAALTEGGFTPDDIKEIVLQQTIYCGVPAANHAMREASAVLQELGLLKG